MDRPYKTRLLVAAIDIGTTYSGYAFSLKDDYKRDPLKIHTSSDWSDGTGLITSKAPTVVLFDRDGTFHSFGYDAEQKYADLCGDDQEEGWKYFRRFKMKLHEKLKLRRNMVLMDDQQQTMPAMRVFATTIKYLKDHMMKKLSDRIQDILEEDIHWVITIPAIWHDGAKQFMNEAACEAGIPEDQLVLALEPEAAAVYCKELSVSIARQEGRSAQLQSFKTGAQFMVLDLGGGTIDITIHEVQGDGTLKELLPPSGGPWGGTLVDANLDEFLEKLFTKDVLDEFKRDCKPDNLDFQRTVEIKKRQVKESATEDATVNIRLPNELFNIYDKKKVQDFETAVAKGKFANTVRKKRDRIHVAHEYIVQMFRESKDKLINHVEEILRKPELINVKTLMMVGGFSNSEIMKTAVKTAFPNKSVIVPDQADIAVVRGAVMYGHNTDSIHSRQLAYSYGISTAVPFDPKKHPNSKKVLRDGGHKCEDVFRVFVKAGTTMFPFKTKAEYTFTAPFISSPSVTVEVYKSPSENPMYVSDAGCSMIGEIGISLLRNQPGEKVMVVVVMLFGDTELHVEAREHGTNNKAVAKFNFLG